MWYCHISTAVSPSASVHMAIPSVIGTLGQGPLKLAVVSAASLRAQCASQTTCMSHMKETEHALEQGMAEANRAKPAHAGRCCPGFHHCPISLPGWKCTLWEASVMIGTCHRNLLISFLVSLLFSQTLIKFFYLYLLGLKIPQSQRGTHLEQMDSWGHFTEIGYRVDTEVTSMELST